MCSIPSGSYRAQPGTGAQLALIGKDPAQPFILEAEPFKHDTNLIVPLAALQTDNEAHDLVLLLPEGNGLEAVGRPSGIQGRGPLTNRSRLSNLPTQTKVFVPQPRPGWVHLGGLSDRRIGIPVGRNQYGPVTICRGTLKQWPQNLYIGTYFENPNSGGCVLPYGKVYDQYDVLAAIWQPSNNGAIPQGAYPMGGPQFACRAYYSGGQVPGRIRTGMTGCSIGWKGKEIAVPFYDVLLTSFVTLSGSGDELTYSPDRFNHAVSGGTSFRWSYEGDYAPLYSDSLCATRYQGEIHPGRLNSTQQACVIGVNGTEKLLYQFSIVQAKLIAIGDSSPLVAGKSSQAGYNPLYACVHVNSQANETHVGFINPDYVSGSDPGTCDFTTADGVFSRVPSREVQPIRDMYSGAHPNWDPAVKP